MDMVVKAGRGSGSNDQWQGRGVDINFDNMY